MMIESGNMQIMPTIEVDHLNMDMRKWLRDVLIMMTYHGILEADVKWMMPTGLTVDMYNKFPRGESIAMNRLVMAMDIEK